MIGSNCIKFPQLHHFLYHSSTAMEVVAAPSSTSILKTVKAFALSITKTPITPKILTLNVANSIQRNKTTLFITHCSTKPNTNTNNETNRDSIFETNSSPNSQNQTSPVSSDNIPTSSLSSPSLSKGLVFDLGPTDSWDCNELGSPVVKRFISDDEERWYMWYHGNSGGSDSIGLAVSSNGIHWERGLGIVGSSGDAGLVMNCSDDWWGFDTMCIRPSEIIIMSSSKVRASSSVYWLYYTGFNSEKVDFLDDESLEFKLENPEIFYSSDNASLGNDGKVRIFKSLPGLAMSQDGRHWARIEGEHHSGALFDVGSEKEWDSLFIAGPHVVFHGNGDLRMYYHSFDVENRHFGIGIARSRDGMKWVKLGRILGGGKTGSFDEFGVMNACVVKNKKDSNYVMAYEGVGANGKRSIGLAVSPDGLKNWRRFQDEAVLEPSENGWDSNGVGSPCLIHMGEEGGDEWKLYYRGVGKNGRTGIGMAVSQGNNMSSFRKWTRLQL